MDGGCEKLDGQKVCWKFNDLPGYVKGLELKSSLCVFLVYLSYVERAAACDITSIHRQYGMEYTSPIW